MQNGYTITPQVAEGPEGEVLMDFDVQSDAGKQQGIANFERTDHYWEDQDGQMHHHLEDYDMASAERFEDDYVEELSSDDFESFLTPEDQSYLMDLTGSETEYAAMTSWMSDNAPQEINDAFNRLLQDGNVEELESVIKAMHNHYKLNS